MKAINKLLLLILSISILASCDNRDEYFEDLNTAPGLTLMKDSQNEMNQDSVKLSLKSGRTSSTFLASVEDKEKNIEEVSIRFLIGNGTVTLNGVETNSTKPTNNAVNISVEPRTMGINKIEVTAKDGFGKSISKTVTITAFHNMSPSAFLEVNPIRVNGPYEYEIDASKSLDGDYNFGGYIALYTFTINGQVIRSTTPKIPFNFGKSGNFSINLKVTDNDGESSSDYFRTITIQ